MAPREYSIKDFKLGKELGVGGFAHVYYAESLIPGCPKEVAIKMISNAKIRRLKIEDRVIKEKEIHKCVNHANIVRCYATFEDKDYTYFVLELCPFTLEEYLKKERNIIKVEVCAFEIIKQIVAGLHYLHGNRIMHRDLSLRNILVTADKQIKIADFGLSILFKTASDPLFSIVGTRKFQSPEMQNHKPYGLPSDCWSLGMIILAVLGGEVPSDYKDTEIPNTFSPEAQKLVSGLLQVNPNDRWSLKKVMESSFFKKYDTLCDSHPVNGIDFYNSRTKNGSSRDSGMDSIGTSFVTTGKSSQQSQQQLDSGFDGINKSTKSRNNYKIYPLSTILSSEHSYQSNPSKTRHKRDFNKHLIPSLERDKNKLAIPNTCYQTLLSRHAPTSEKLSYETIGHAGYTEALSKEHHFHAPLPLAANCDKRERSASEEQRKQERQRLLSEMKISYSGDTGHVSHHSRNMSKSLK